MLELTPISFTEHERYGCFWPKPHSCRSGENELIKSCSGPKTVGARQDFFMVFNQVFIQMYFSPEDFFNVFIRLLSRVFIRDAPGISEKDENRSKSTKVTKVASRIRMTVTRMWIK